jgi:hypothetical protein
MNVLISYHNGNAYGGSEIFHHELILGLLQFKDIKLTISTFTSPNKDFHMFKDMVNNGLEVLSLKELTNNTKYDNYFDIIIVSQPIPNQILCEKYPTVPKILVVHSAIRSEEVLFHDSIKHFCVVQPDIYRCLKNQYNIKTKDISLLYNPFDINRFKKYPQHNKKVNGVLVGEINDPLRRPMIEHAVQNCINEGMELTIISKSKFDYKHDLIKVVDQCYNTEDYLKYADFTVGLGGRQLIEGWLCGIPGYIYKVKPDGSILDIQLKYPPKILRFERSYVSSQYYNLINKYVKRN